MDSATSVINRFSQKAGSSRAQNGGFVPSRAEVREQLARRLDCGYRKFKKFALKRPTSHTKTEVLSIADARTACEDWMASSEADRWR